MADRGRLFYDSDGKLRQVDPAASISGEPSESDLEPVEFVAVTTDQVNITDAGRIQVSSSGGLYIHETTLSPDTPEALNPNADVFAGLVFIVAANDSAAFETRGVNNAVNEIFDSGDDFSTTEDTDNSINVWWDSGNSRYEIENTFASPINTFMIGLVRG